MRKILVTVMAVMVSAGVALAGSTSKGKSCAKMPSITGEVTAVDTAAGKISIKDPKGNVTEWLVAPDAKVMVSVKGKKTATLADVAVGDAVTLCYEETNGVKTVKSVKAKAPKKAKADKGKGGKK